MPRDYKVFLDDILGAIAKVRRYTAGFSQEEFFKDEKTLDAVARNLEIIGEAVKKIPPRLRTQYPSVDWKKVAGLRDILVHEYFGIDSEIIWDILQNKLPGLEKQVQRMLQSTHR
ncbi:MAG: DUF86 domain-containing protein [Deltaproteobacteria bacterium]|nr:DUF86 domain-containing protein [Deltaproteobacteria bacterium]